MIRADCAASLLVLVFTALGADAQEPAPTPFPTWKDEIAKNYLPYHQLTVADFPINDAAHPKNAFYVQPFVHWYYRYGLKPADNGFVYAFVTDWVVCSGFDKNLSSRNSRFREMKAALPYIQAGFDLEELHAREFAAIKPGDLPSGRGETFEKARAELEDRVRALVQTKMWESQKELDTFLKATNNGQNQKKVRELAAEIKKRLAATRWINPPPGTATPTSSIAPSASPAQ